MSRAPSRTFAVGGLAAGAAAAFVAISAALSSSPTTIGEAKAAEATIASRTHVFPGGGRVIVKVQPGGLACFRVLHGSSTVARSCMRGLATSEIAYASSRYAVGGMAGSDVRAVIVKLTGKGTVWATLRGGAFYAKVPAKHNVRAVIKVLRGGTRTSFTVTGSR